MIINGHTPILFQIRGRQLAIRTLPGYKNPTSQTADNPFTQDGIAKRCNYRLLQIA